MASKTTAAAAGTIDIGGDLTVNRLGFGAMRITGHGIWGEPPDREQAKAALRRARGARRQLHRHRRLLRAGRQRGAHRRGPVPLPRRPGHRDQGRPDPPGPEPLGARRPARAPARGLRGQPAAAAARADPAVPVPPARPQGAAGGLDRRAGRAEGRGQDPARRRVQLRPSDAARARPSGSSRWCRCRTATTSPTGARESVVDLCEQESSRFLPWAPIQEAEKSRGGARPPRAHGVSERQVALAWLLARSPQILPIPGPARPSTWRRTSPPRASS